MTKKIIYTISVIIILTISLFIRKSRLDVDVEGSIFNNFDNVEAVKQVSENFYYFYDTKSTFGKPSSILSIAEAEGYSGKIKVGVNYNKNGQILSVKVLSQTETPGFWRRVTKANFIEQYQGKNIQEKFLLNENIDAVSRATISCVGINSAIQKANIQTCQLYFKDKFSTEKTWVKIQSKDLLIFFLYFFAILFAYSRNKWLKKLRLVYHLVSVVLLGFVFKGLLSITHFNNLILLNIPLNQYYWFLVVGLFLLSIFILGKNLYFAYICPMGIIQDYLGKLFPWQLKFKNKKYYQYPVVLLTLGILCYAIIANQPGFFGHEIFGNVFQFDFSSYVFIIAIISLILSLFIKRFWCRFLCPVGVIGRFLMMVRKIFVTKRK